MITLAYEAWAASAPLRQRRERYKRYTYGRQWDDPASGPDGRHTTEGELASSRGHTPLTNNMIRQLVKCVIGNFRSSIAQSDPAAAIKIDPSTALRCSLMELDCRMLEEFLISGCAIQRVVAEHRIAGEGVWVDNVSPRDFFVNRFTDSRGLDIELIGMLHSMSLREVLMRYGSTPAQCSTIRQAYGATPCGDTPAVGLNIDTEFFDAGPGKCRVIELWTLESRSLLRCHDPEQANLFLTPADPAAADRLLKVNARRTASGRPSIESTPFTTLRWHCRMLAPNGIVLEEFDSPYAHGLHPFAVKFFPLTDGEVHSFVEDIIDQQRHINRLITLIDHIIGVSAKGVLLFPIDQKPADASWESITQAWAKCDGVIRYDPRHSTHIPRQIISSGADAGASQLLAMQLQLFQQISGVSDALQGRASSTNPSASLFDSQLRSSTVALLDLFDSFNSFRLQRNRLIANSGI